MNSGKILLAALTAMAAGIIVGMLFAPEKGSVTRQKLIDNATDLTDIIKSTATDAIDKINSIRNKAMGTMEDEMNA